MPPTNLLAGKTAIITGGTTGIGRSIALEFLRQGCSVAVNHLGLESDRAHLESLVAEAEAISSSSATAGRLTHLPGDVREPATGTALVSHALTALSSSRLDICVSNAGICTFAEFLDLDAALYDKTARTNLDGCFYVVQAAARQMARG